MLATVLRKIVPARWRPIEFLNRKTFKETAGQVRAGVFAGMKYVNASYGSCYIPKLLGIYERELNEAIETASAAAPDTVVDIGAAEGYYAIGLCRRLPAAKIVAYEMSESARRLLAEMAALN